MHVRLALAVGAAACFVAGSMLMKPASGFGRLVPTLGVFACFALGVTLDVLLVRAGDEVGPAVVLIVGLELVFSVLLAAWLFGEQLSPARIVAVVLVLAGMVALGLDVRHAPTGTPAVLPVEPLAELGAAGDAELGVDALQVGVDRAA